MAVSEVAAVILAGGRGERLGGANKATIEIGGLRLVDRVRTALAGCEPILIAAGRTPLALEGVRAVPDLDSDYAGPLAGVAAAVHALRDTEAQWLLSVAVDTPFFPPDFIDRANQVRGEVDVVVGCYGAQNYPTNALWRLTAIRTLPDDIHNGTAPHSLKRLIAALRSARLDYSPLAPEDPFANVNTAEDLMNLRSRESSMTRG